MRTVETTAVALLVVLCCSAFAPAWGLTATGEVAGVAYSIYAPAWTWQKRNINILIKAENKTTEPRTLTVRLHLPANAPDAFQAPDDSKGKTAELQPGAVKRVAIVNVKARAEKPLGDYVFRITLAAGGQKTQLDYPVKTVRGAVVRPGIWVALLPVVITLAWCVVFILVLPRYAAAGAWRKPGPAIAPPSKLEEWIREA